VLEREWIILLEESQLPVPPIVGLKRQDYVWIVCPDQFDEVPGPAIIHEYIGDQEADGGGTVARIGVGDLLCGEGRIRKNPVALVAEAHGEREEKGSL
jgi:hypothetical protein